MMMRRAASVALALVSAAEEACGTTIRPVVEEMRSGSDWSQRQWTSASDRNIVVGSIGNDGHP